MVRQFSYDVIIACAFKDAKVLEELARKLRAVGLRVWVTDRGPLLTGEDQELAEDVIEAARVMVLVVSNNVSTREWSELERISIAFRDPMDPERRFILLRMDDSSVSPPLSHYGYIDWRLATDSELDRLVHICRPRILETRTQHLDAKEVIRGHDDAILRVAISPDGFWALSGGADEAVRLWNLEQGTCADILVAHKGAVTGVAISNSAKLAVSASLDATMRIWNLSTGRCITILESEEGPFTDVAVSDNARIGILGSEDGKVHVWDLQKHKCLMALKGHTGRVNGVAISLDGIFGLSASSDSTVRIWDLTSGECVSILRGHNASVNGVAMSHDKAVVVSGSDDRTVRIWSVQGKRCVATLEGHTGAVKSVALTSDGRVAASASLDSFIRIWGVRWGECVGVLRGHTGGVTDIGITPDGRRAVSVGLCDGTVRVWAIPIYEQDSPVDSDLARYTNAKVLLVGDSGVGKTGLALRLTENKFEATVSSHAAWATQLKLAERPGQAGTEREIWLWDFGGQSDYRLVHQLFMDEAALALLVFNPQDDDPFEGLTQWDRALQRAARRPFKKILVAGRCDRGGLTVSKRSIEGFWKERGFACFIETSALTGENCASLKKAMEDAILWEDIPWRSSPRLFKQLKDIIISLRDEGRALLRVIELKQQIELRAINLDFTIEELRAVVGLLAGPGVVWQLEFGDFVLLRPEIINAYAAAVIRSVRSHTDEIGCIAEESVLAGDLIFQDMPRLPLGEEQIVLRAMHHTLVGHGLCLREHTDKGSQLIFPAYFKRERPDLDDHPAVFVSYRFGGPLDEIYATLVVRLHHTPAFEKVQLWRFAADFNSPEGKRVGLKMDKRGEGIGEITVYFDPMIPDDT
ncbi:MAG: TIR domain-containing protein, partial [Limisphaerales bacterium]